MARNDDLISGSIGKKVISFAAPIILANLIQAIYGIVDMVTVGHFVGASGMSAVSMGAQITTVVLVIINGLSNGATIISAQLTGRGKHEEIRFVIGSVLAFFGILAIALTAIVMLLARPLLTAINTPDVAFDQAVQYLLINISTAICRRQHTEEHRLLQPVSSALIPKA